MVLGHYGRIALLPLLQALTRPTINARPREGAHRVLSHITAPQAFDHRQELLDALQGPGANIATIDVAMKILRKWK
jgi:hypothetical protein